MFIYISDFGSNLIFDMERLRIKLWEWLLRWRRGGY